MAVDHYYHRDAVEKLIKAERQRGTRLQTENNKLTLALYDQRELHRMVEESTREGFKNYFERRPKRVKYVKDAGELFVAHAPIADPHLGKYVWGKEGWGEDYDTGIACARIRQCGEEARDWILDQNGRCSRLYATNVGDFWHAIDGKTESGTLLHQDTRAKKVIAQGVEAELYRIDALRSCCEELVVEFTEGNHDHIHMHQTYREIAAELRHCPDVTVHVRDQKMVWFKVGRVVHFIDHGKGLNTLGTASSQLKGWNAINMVMTPADQAYVEHYYYYIGHLHHREVAENVKMEMVRLPAIAEGDYYEEELRVGSRVGGEVYRLDDEGYVRDQHNIRFRDA